MVGFFVVQDLATLEAVTAGKPSDDIGPDDVAGILWVASFKDVEDTRGINAKKVISYFSGRVGIPPDFSCTTLFDTAVFD